MAESTSSLGSTLFALLEGRGRPNDESSNAASTPSADGHSGLHTADGLLSEEQLVDEGLVVWAAQLPVQTDGAPRDRVEEVSKLSTLLHKLMLPGILLQVFTLRLTHGALALGAVTVMAHLAQKNEYGCRLWLYSGAVDDYGSKVVRLTVMALR